jgi:hypothetical protein
MSVDGCIEVYTLNWKLMNPSSVTVEKVQTLQHLNVTKGHLCCQQGSPCSHYFNVNKNYKQAKKNLNQGVGNAGLDDPAVPLRVMDMAPFGGRLLGAKDRHIMKFHHCLENVQNLWGHQNDDFSHPKIAWSKNWQYLYGNSQDGSGILPARIFLIGWKVMPTLFKMYFPVNPPRIQ